ncbi:efflux RND transporter periplasmic adaptor subunit [Uliginosibacterium sp. H1]|uniref:efflux RND transporter periplasmic adaptor subunit n=1 Tax=Uliginosibacterium sp. H1 TaxID=3114757 RepID=UPI002E18A65D|nr:efflux RND transporter periplasmic adaptor subunit [Uliginosibacterium sp. H1]
MNAAPEHPATRLGTLSPGLILILALLMHPTAAHAQAGASVPAGWGGAAPRTSTPASRGDTLGCLLLPTAEAEVGSPVVGVLEKVNVERGDRVKKGQVVAQLVNDVERAATMAAERRHENRADVAAARHAWEFAQKKAERAEELFQQKFISSQARDQAVSEAKVAAMKYAQTQEMRLVAKQDLEVARAQLGLRNIHSPINGVVVDRYLAAGERVEDKPILKLAQIDPLRVEVVVPSSRFNQIKAGGNARVTPDLAGLGEQTARITVVDAVIDPASNTFRVRLELPNPNGAIPSGLRCKVDFSG